MQRWLRVLFALTIAATAPGALADCLAQSSPGTTPSLTLAALPAAQRADPVTLGALQRRILGADPQQDYYLYVPRHGGQGAPLFVTVHGVSRDAQEQSTLFAPYAERYGAVMLAPCYSSERYPDYQRLSRIGRGPRSDEALDRMVAEVAQLTGARTDKLYLFGYSGGAQFVHHYTLAHPERVARVVIGAAGWYTLPDLELHYPAGVESSRKLPGVSFDPQRFLAVPTCVLVGELDTAHDPHLREGPRLNAREGDTRLLRGENWIEAMRSEAGKYGLHTEFHFEVLPHVAHSFRDAMELGGMGPATFRFLFGPPPA